MDPATRVVGNGPPIAGEGATAWGLVAGKARDERSRLQVPDLQRLVIRGGYRAKSVRTHRDSEAVMNFPDAIWRNALICSAAERETGTM